MKFFNSNPFEAKASGFEQSKVSENFANKLQAKFTPREFHQRFAVANMAALAVGYFCNLLSFLTESVAIGYLVYSSISFLGFTLSMSMAVVFGVSIAIAIELIKRTLTGEVLKSAFQYKRFKAGMMLSALVIMSCSAVASWYGAKQLPEITQEIPSAPPSAQAKTDSVRAFYQGLIAKAEKDHDDFKKQHSNRDGKIYYKDSDADAKMAQNVLDLRNKMLDAIKQEESKTDSINKIVSDEYRLTVSDLKQDSVSLALKLTVFAILVELLYVLVSVFCFWYDWKSYVELCAMDDEPDPVMEPDRERESFNETRYEKEKEKEEPIPTVAPIAERKIGFKINDPKLEKLSLPQCRYCGTHFVPRHAAQKYCTNEGPDSCKAKAYEQRSGNKYTYK